jgi:hypothetical protein
MAQEVICASLPLPVLLVACCILRGLRRRPSAPPHLQHVDLKFVETRVLKQKGAGFRQKATVVPAAWPAGASQVTA